MSGGDAYGVRLATVRERQGCWACLEPSNVYRYYADEHGRAVATAGAAAELVTSCHECGNRTHWRDGEPRYHSRA